jgi:osmotically-inducible protein OsmY
MGWLKRLFGQEKPRSGGNQQAATRSAAAPQAAQRATASRNTAAGPSASSSADNIPAERVGLNGEYDDSGLAKRVALAFDEDSTLDDIETLWVAQTGSTVVLKGTVPNQQILDRMVSVAKGVRGAKAVDTTQAKVQ